MDKEPNIVRSVEQVVCASYVRYEKLQSLVYNTFSNTSIAQATKLNVFVDLYSVMKSIFSEHGHTDLSKGNYTDLTSCLINLCAHYRNFFRTLGVYTRFFLIFSLNTGDFYTKFIQNYNMAFKQKSEVKLFKDMVGANFQLLDIITPYIPDVHFIHSDENYESTVIMSYIINNYSEGCPNLIISRDLYPLQLCTTHPYTSYLYPIKRYGQDDSIMVSISEKPSFREDFWNLVGTIRQFDPSKLYDISPVNFPLLSALNRFPERGLPALANIVAAKNIIKESVGEEDIKTSPIQLLATGKASDTLIRQAEPRYNCLDVMFAYSYYCNTPEAISIKLDNLQDNGQLENINSKYFANNPMRLIDL